MIENVHTHAGFFFFKFKFTAPGIFSRISIMVDNATGNHSFWSRGFVIVIDIFLYSVECKTTMTFRLWFV